MSSNRLSRAIPYEGAWVPLELIKIPKVFVGVGLWVHHFGIDTVGLAKERTSGRKNILPIIPQRLSFGNFRATPPIWHNLR